MIEIKTVLGDEYPRVLREVKSRFAKKQGHELYILLVDQVATESITREELSQIFAREGVKLVYFSDIEDFEDFEDESSVLEKRIAVMEEDLDKLKKRRKLTMLK